MRRHLVQKVTTEKLQAAANPLVRLFGEAQFVEDIEMKMKQSLGFVAGARKIAFGERAGNAEQAIRNAFHGGDDYDDVRGFRSRADERGSVEHSLGTENRCTTKLKRNHRLLGGCGHRARTQRVKAGWQAASCKKRGGDFFLHVFGTHDLGSWFPQERLWRGLNEEAHRRIRFWRWA
jgi:hypothetical protein